MRPSELRPPPAGLRVRRDSDRTASRGIPADARRGQGQVLELGGGRLYKDRTLFLIWLKSSMKLPLGGGRDYALWG